MAALPDGDVRHGLPRPAVQHRHRAPPRRAGLRRRVRRLRRRSSRRACERTRELLAPHGTLYLHLDYREAHRVKVVLDEHLRAASASSTSSIWVYDYGGRPKRRWPAKHDTILVYVRDRDRYHFDDDEVDREPYMAPGLVGPEKAARGKRPTRLLVAHDRPDERAREDRLPDAEARGHRAADGRRVVAAGRLVPGPVRRLGHARRRLPRPRAPLRARRRATRRRSRSAARVWSAPTAAGERRGTTSGLDGDVAPRTSNRCRSPRARCGGASRR